MHSKFPKTQNFYFLNFYSFLKYYLVENNDNLLIVSFWKINYCKYVSHGQWELTSIHTCRSYVHTPRDIPRTAHLYSVTFTSARLYGNINRMFYYSSVRALADSPADFGLLGEQSSPKWEIPCLGRRWTAVPCKIRRRYSFILSGKIRNNDKQTNKQTVNDISTPCLSACVNQSRFSSGLKVAFFRTILTHSGSNGAFSQTLS